MVAETELVGAEAGRLGLLVQLAAGPQLDFGEWRGVEVQVAAAKPRTGDHPAECHGQLGVAVRGGVTLPGIESRRELAQTEQTGRVPARVRGGMRGAHHPEPSRPSGSMRPAAGRLVAAGTAPPGYRPTPERNARTTNDRPRKKADAPSVSAPEPQNLVLAAFGTTPTGRPSSYWFTG